MSQVSIYKLTMTKAYLGDFRLSSVCNTYGRGKVALLWLLLQYKACPRTKSASRPRKGQLAKNSCWCFGGGCGACGQSRLEWRQLWLKRVRVQGSRSPWLARCVTGFLLFAFCGLCCWHLQCRHFSWLWFYLFFVMGFVVWVVLFFFPVITRDELAACEMWAI